MKHSLVNLSRSFLNLALLTTIALFSSCSKESPFVDFSYFEQNSPEPSIYFSNKSVNAEKFFWDFGDGTTSTDRNYTHRYSSNGTYLVKLTGTSADKISKETSQLVTVKNIKGTFMFYITKNTGSAVDVWVDNIYIGRITKYFSGSGYPQCGTEGFAQGQFAEGKHDYYAKTLDGIYIFKGTFMVESGKCRAASFN